jgi:hypothetical protein
MVGKLALVAALAGSAVGAAAVLADEPAPAPAVPAVATPAAPKERAYTGSAPRDIEIIRREPDPSGGAPWAVRRFAATLANGTVVNCFELGRLDGEAFGWIDGSGAFKPVEPGRFDTPADCKAPIQQRKLGASPQRFTTVSLPAGGTPKPLETVTFGTAAPTVAGVKLRDEPPLTPDADGVFLRIREGEADGPLPTTVVTYRDGHTTTINLGGEIPARAGVERSLPGTDYVAAQAPDPAGGQPWALLGSRGTHGGTCLSTAGRLVGTQLGILNREKAFFVPGSFGVMRICDDKTRKPTRAYPMRLTTLSSSIDDGDPRGRIERRVQDTRIVFHGRVHPDVVTVTIHTPRDVRTLVPSSRAHAIIAVYDGGFPGGKVTATARLEDGSEVTRSIYSG